MNLKTAARGKFCSDHYDFCAKTKQLEIKSRSGLRHWLEEHHTTISVPIWLVVWRKGTEFYLPWGDVVSELLCWGWIDSTRRAVDDQRTSFRISRRRAKSTWSGLNKVKVDEEREAMRMTAAGESSIAVAHENGMWNFLDEVEALVTPTDLQHALGEQLHVWESYPKNLKCSALHRIKMAKTETTRAKRIQEEVRHAVDRSLLKKCI